MRSCADASNMPARNVFDIKSYGYHQSSRRDASRAGRD